MSNNGHSNGQIKCLFEDIFRKAGYRVVYDGQTAERKDVQFNISPAERRFFTRHLRKVENGKFVDSWVVFRYDTRSGFCFDCQATKEEPGVPRVRQRMTSGRR